jgi:hypothetical protein
MNKLQPLSDISGMPIAEIENLFVKIKENQRRLNGCPCHNFGTVVLVSSISAKWTCEVCGGEMSIGDIRLYAAGYAASGGAEADIWTLTRAKE